MLSTNIKGGPQSLFSNFFNYPILFKLYFITESFVRILFVRFAVSATHHGRTGNFTEAFQVSDHQHPCKIYVRAVHFVQTGM